MRTHSMYPAPVSDCSRVFVEIPGKKKKKKRQKNKEKNLNLFSPTAQRKQRLNSTACVRTSFPVTGSFSCKNLKLVGASCDDSWRSTALYRLFVSHHAFS